MVTDTVRRFVKTAGIDPCHILIAVSGGTDSTALLLAAAELRSNELTVTAGHVNHHLRGVESDEDESFVRDLAHKLGVPLLVADGSIPEELIRSKGIEAAAREVRTALLQSMRAECGAGYIATAHQLDDQAETVFMRLITGTSIAGLRGIHPFRDDGVIRPLLDLDRETLRQFLADRAVTPREDRMNDDARYLRVRVRRFLARCDRETRNQFASVAEHARRLWTRVEDALDSIPVTATPTATRFDEIPPDDYLRRALLLRHIRRLDPHSRDISAEDLARLGAAMTGPRTRISVTATVELVRRDRAVLLRRTLPPVPPFERQVMGRVTEIPEVAIAIQVLRSHAAGIPPSPIQAFELPRGADATFVVRNRRAGDRFQPLGLTGTKKLKDFMIDRRIPRDERDRIPLLVWGGEIVWIGGLAVSERFKVTGDGDRYEAVLLPAARPAEDPSADDVEP